jgi:hypothetical protein
MPFMDNIRYYEADGTQADYKKKQRDDCRNSTLYCVISLALLIAGGAATSPYFIDAVPGGRTIANFLTVGVVIGVMILCYWQTRRPR